MVPEFVLGGKLFKSAAIKVGRRAMASKKVTKRRDGQQEII